MLGDLIKALESCPEGAVFERGFSNPHSYRGSYYELAVEPDSDVTREEMLKCLRSVLDTELEGYKGGEFLMHDSVDVYLANQGCTSTTFVVGWGIKGEGVYTLLTEEDVDW